MSQESQPVGAAHFTNDASGVSNCHAPLVGTGPAAPERLDEFQMLIIRVINDKDILFVERFPENGDTLQER